jgi:hypothetical protein
MANALASELLNWNHSNRNATAQLDPDRQPEIGGLQREDFASKVIRKTRYLLGGCAFNGLGLGVPEKPLNSIDGSASQRS